MALWQRWPGRRRACWQLVEQSATKWTLSYPFVQGGYIVLTNYRLIWIGASHSRSHEHSSSAAAAGVPCHLPLPAVSDAEHKSGMLVKAARIKLAVRVDSASYPTAGEELLLVGQGSKSEARRRRRRCNLARSLGARPDVAPSLHLSRWAPTRLQHALPTRRTLLRRKPIRSPCSRPWQTPEVWHAWRHSRWSAEAPPQRRCTPS